MFEFYAKEPPVPPQERVLMLFDEMCQLVSSDSYLTKQLENLKYLYPGFNRLNFKSDVRDQLTEDVKLVFQTLSSLDSQSTIDPLFFGILRKAFKDLLGRLEIEQAVSQMRDFSKEGGDQKESESPHSLQLAEHREQKIPELIQAELSTVLHSALELYQQKIDCAARIKKTIELAGHSRGTFLIMFLPALLQFSLACEQEAKVDWQKRVASERLVFGIKEVIGRLSPEEIWKLYRLMVKTYKSDLAYLTLLSEEVPDELHEGKLNTLRFIDFRSDLANMYKRLLQVLSLVFDEAMLNLLRRTVKYKNKIPKDFSLDGLLRSKKKDFPKPLPISCLSLSLCSALDECSKVALAVGSIDTTLSCIHALLVKSAQTGEPLLRSSALSSLSLSAHSSAADQLDKKGSSSDLLVQKSQGESSSELKDQEFASLVRAASQDSHRQENPVKLNFWLRHRRGLKKLALWSAVCVCGAVGTALTFTGVGAPLGVLFQTVSVKLAGVSLASFLALNTIACAAVGWVIGAVSRFFVSRRVNQSLKNTVQDHGKAKTAIALVNAQVEKLEKERQSCCIMHRKLKRQKTEDLRNLADLIATKRHGSLVETANYSPTPIGDSVQSYVKSLRKNGLLPSFMGNRSLELCHFLRKIDKPEWKEPMLSSAPVLSLRIRS